MNEGVGFVRFIRRYSLLVFAILMICAMGSEVYAAQQTDWTGNLNVFLGRKTLDDYWDPLDEQDEFGLKFDFRQRSWPVSIAIEYSYSSDDDDISYVDVEGNTSELCFGIRKIWDHFPNVRPFIGGGIAVINAELELSAFGYSESEDDWAVGIWFGGGVYWTLSEHFNIGLDLKWSLAMDVSLFDEVFDDFDPGGSHFGLLIGYHW